MVNGERDGSTGGADGVVVDAGGAPHAGIPGRSVLLHRTPPAQAPFLPARARATCWKATCTRPPSPGSPASGPRHRFHHRWTVADGGRDGTPRRTAHRPPRPPVTHERLTGSHESGCRLPLGTPMPPPVTGVRRGTDVVLIVAFGSDGRLRAPGAGGRAGRLPGDRQGTGRAPPRPAGTAVIGTVVRLPATAIEGGPGPFLDERRPGRHRLPSAAGLPAGVVGG